MFMFAARKLLRKLLYFTYPKRAFYKGTKFVRLRFPNIHPPGSHSIFSLTRILNETRTSHLKQNTPHPNTRTSYTRPSAPRPIEARAPPLSTPDRKEPDTGSTRHPHARTSPGTPRRPQGAQRTQHE